MQAELDEIPLLGRLSPAPPDALLSRTRRGMKPASRYRSYDGAPLRRHPLGGRLHPSTPSSPHEMCANSDGLDHQMVLSRLSAVVSSRTAKISQPASQAKSKQHRPWRRGRLAPIQIWSPPVVPDTECRTGWADRQTRAPIHVWGPPVR